MSPDARQRSLCLARARIWGTPEWNPNTTRESAFRFGEEAIELLQTDLTEDEVIALVCRVYSRPVGDPVMEVGQAGICLAMYAENIGVSLDEEMNHHHDLLNNATPEQVEKWRQKHTAKLLAGVATGGRW